MPTPAQDFSTTCPPKPSPECFSTLVPQAREWDIADVGEVPTDQTDISSSRTGHSSGGGSEELLGCTVPEPTLHRKQGGVAVSVLGARHQPITRFNSTRVAQRSKDYYFTLQMKKVRISEVR